MPDQFTTLTALKPSTSSSQGGISARWKTRLHSAALQMPLDRVNVLGGDSSGHTGCVNALSWARDGEILLSGGDDTTVRLWRIDSSDTEQEYPFVCDAVIRTGHRDNIFNAQLLPHSARIATVARDGQVRISDVGDCMQQAVNGRETVYSTRQTNLRVLKCHQDSVKRIVTEDSPDLFLTVSEDGTVRQHDLRVNHTCSSEGSCPEPLVQMRHELSTLALSPLTPYQFVVAGDASYGYLFDRRQSGRHLRYEWGMSPSPDSVTTCVRRFGRKMQSRNRIYDHITGARMAQSNGHEVLLSYSSDAVYRYSVYDEVVDKIRSPSATIPSNNPLRTDTNSSTPGSSVSDATMESDIARYMAMDEADEEADEVSDEEDHESAPKEMSDEEDELNFSSTPIILPRSRYAGARNVDTVKDVNFLGPHDEFVVSGSDDGNFFIWEKGTEKLHDILEGDGSIVNVVEGHPHLPLIAVSGIDTSVKLFAPAHGPRTFSRIDNAISITQRNSDALTSSSIALRNLAAYAHLSHALGVSVERNGQCQHQ